LLAEEDRSLLHGTLLILSVLILASLLTTKGGGKGGGKREGGKVKESWKLPVSSYGIISLIDRKSWIRKGAHGVEMSGEECFVPQECL